MGWVFIVIPLLICFIMILLLCTDDVQDGCILLELLLLLLYIWGRVKNFMF